MTMDYGTSGTEMGTAANQALDATAGQLESIYGISASAAYAMLGNTPMIGQNDTSGEIFTLADASTVESYAAQQGIALLSFWAEGRDNGGCPGAHYGVVHLQRDQPVQRRLHPGVPALHHRRRRRRRRRRRPPRPRRRRRRRRRAGSCAAAWVSNIAYVSGNEVSYDGDNWTANQWNYDEVPGGASGAWNNDGAC